MNLDDEINLYSTIQCRFERLMRIWLNLEKVEFRTNFRPASEFGVHDVERFRNALKLL